jgi:hypothetical protein
MIRWCQLHLGAVEPQFRFHHQNIRNIGFNPGGTLDHQAFPVGDREVSLLFAWSVFTHVREASAAFYIDEVARVLRRDGRALTTWFLFDKGDFPMMQTFQNALFINDIDPTNAVIFDREWLLDRLSTAGLVTSRVDAPGVRGFQWLIELRPAESGAVAVEFPPDLAPRRPQRPPLLPQSAPEIGLKD